MRDAVTEQDELFHGGRAFDDETNKERYKALAQ